MLKAVAAADPRFYMLVNEGTQYGTAVGGLGYDINGNGNIKLLMVVGPLVLLLVPIIVQIIHLISLLLMMRQITGVLVGIMAIGVIGQLTLWIKRMAILQ